MRVNTENFKRKNLFKDWKRLAFLIDSICDLTQKKDISDEDIEDYKIAIEQLKENVEELDAVTEKLLLRWKKNS